LIYLDININTKYINIKIIYITCILIVNLHINIDHRE
jgi:hypothetical protein